MSGLARWLPMGRRRQQSRWWKLPAAIMAALVLLPLSVIVLSWGQAEVEIWQHLIATQLSDLLVNSLLLMLGVGIGVTLIGVSLAWLTAVCDFPGRRWLDWALVLPFAIPTYVVAFVTLGLMDYAGPVQSLWREVFGRQAWFPDLRSAGGVAAVMTAVLYPYVYLLARSAFLDQGRERLDAARLLGASPLRAFFKVAIPNAWPAIAAGTALALMEALADFGAVSIFNYDTFTTAIYKSWFGFFSLAAAAQLASLLLVIVGLLLYVERRSRSRGRSVKHGGKATRYRLQGGRAWLAFAWCALVFALAFLVPVGRLLYWVISSGFAGLDARFLEHIGHTLVLAVSAALLVVLPSFLIAYAQRGANGQQSPAVGIASLGYALPGSVLAVGIVLAFAFIDNRVINPLGGWFGAEPGQVLVGSLLALLLAYVVRFFSVGYGPVESAMQRIRPHYHDAGQLLGASAGRILRRVYLPLLAPGLLTGLLLVFVDVMKEMPATLLLRPFGWETLSLRIYELTAEGQWERAALPALVLVLVGLLPVLLLIRHSRSRH